jgi:hypothetical protein
MKEDLARHDVIDQLEVAMLAALPLVDQPLEHLFLPGLYVRKVTNPAGSLVTTKIHKTRHPFFVMSGTARIWTAAGEPVQEVTGPYVGVTEPGTRRVINALTDVVWITVHPNPDDGQDLAAIEERLIERRELVPGKTSHELALEGLAAQALAEENHHEP